MVADWTSIMYAEASVEKGTTPGTYTVDFYGSSKNKEAPKKSFPKSPRPSQPNIRR